MIVVIGAAGQLGTAFRRLLGDEARYLTRVDLDLSDPVSIRPILASLHPTALINCAAYTAVDRAEVEPTVAGVVNTAAVGVMAEVMADLGGRFVTFSTDYVFDGTSDCPYVESDPTSPINTYGITKRAGEVAALEAYPASLVIRTSWVISGTHPNFVSTMIRRARAGAVSVINDQFGHPTLVNDLARSTLTALHTDAAGILHLANAGVASWYDLARKIVQYAGLNPDRIRACATADYPTPARRPVNSVIDSERLRDLGLDPLPPYDLGLEQGVAEILTWTH